MKEWDLAQIVYLGLIHASTIFFFCISLLLFNLVHELGHVIAATSVGQKVIGVRVWFAPPGLGGGYTEYRGYPRPTLTQKYIGTFGGLLIWMPIIVIGMLSNIQVLIELARFGLVFTFVNAMPIISSDGYSLVRIIMTNRSDFLSNPYSPPMLAIMSIVLIGICIDYVLAVYFACIVFVLLRTYFNNYSDITVHEVRERLLDSVYEEQKRLSLKYVASYVFFMLFLGFCALYLKYDSWLYLSGYYTMLQRMVISIVDFL